MKVPWGSLFAFAVLGCGVYFFRGWFPGYLTSIANTKAPACLDLLGYTNSEQDGQPIIAGSIRNNCARTYPSVQITFKLDASNNGSFSGVIVSAYGRDLKPGETLEFKTMPIAKDATYRLDEIRAY